MERKQKKRADVRRGDETDVQEGRRENRKGDARCRERDQRSIKETRTREEKRRHNERGEDT